ncbi:MAG: hypothetical protein ACHQQQ_00065 [Bacteroidota bacterium]
MSETTDVEPLTNHEILYLLCEGDITHAGIIRDLPAEEVYRWMLLRLRYAQRVSDRNDSMVLDNLE